MKFDRSMFAVTALMLVWTCVALAQPSYEDRAGAVLVMFESGDRDSAYMLIEELKADRNTRFVPAVLFTRAQMTPDDRALDLYRELIALDPGGTWADDAAYQLVRRYMEKRDSVATRVWMSMLKLNYPRSAYVAQAEEAIAAVHDWGTFEPPPSRPTTSPASAKTSGEPPAKNAAPRPETTVAKGEKTTAKSGVASGADKPVAKTAATKAPTTTTETKTATKPVSTATKTSTTSAAKPSTTTTTTTKTSATKPSKPSTTKDVAASAKMKGYALQVGIYPTKVAADARVRELEKKNLRVQALPKFIDGKKQYALVVGTYATVEEANGKKSEVSTLCDCKAFAVKVE